MPVNIIHSTQGICNFQLDKEVKRREKFLIFVLIAER